MSELRDPPRMIDSQDGVPSFLRAALEAERRNPGPDADHIEQLARRLEVADAALPSGTKASAWTWSRLAALTGVGLVAIAAAAVEMRSRETMAPAVATTVPKPITAPPPLPVEQHRADEPPLVHPDELPTAAPTATASAPVARRTTRAAESNAPARPATTESAEIDLLDRAHDALRSRPAEALALCDKHQAEFADGRFTQEREALAIEALVYLGRRDEAERRWSEFQQRYPTSNHRTHLADLFPSPR